MKSDYVLYRHWDRLGNLLYVGISTSHFSRLSSHSQTAGWFSRIETITLQRYKTMQDLRKGEARAIREEKPMYNKQWSKLPKDIMNYLPAETAQMHPEGMKELAVLSAEYKCNLAGFALVLVALLREREQKNTVTISYEDLAKFVKVSVKTVASTMKLLEEHKFFTRIGKQSYKISPKLAWFGNQVDWAVALQELEQNTQNEEKQNETN